MPKLVLRNLSRTFANFNAVSDVNLQLEKGEFISLLGPSGCGKTTTLRMIAGFIDPTAGQIELDGEVLSSPSGSTPPERRGMSMIFQSYAVWPNMTVAENVAFGLKLKKLGRATVEERVRRILDVVKLSHLAGRYPAELSGGQQQRVALARAIVIEPEVLLLDEPLSNLDANLREEMRSEIRRLHDEFKITSVYVTHDQAEAMVTSDRIAVMSGGRIEQIADPYTLYNRPETRFVASFIGRTNLIEGRLTADRLDLDGFSLPASALKTNTPEGPVTISVRPQSLDLSRTAPKAEGRMIVVPGTIVERAYLGESWDYLLRPAGGVGAIKVSAPPQDVFDIGAEAFMRFSPEQLVILR
jgi:ABC-type Fe3+/spermidine/putrescine transport system ATPase subunit